jgi:hypothetical protein
MYSLLVIYYLDLFRISIFELYLNEVFHSASNDPQDNRDQYRQYNHDAGNRHVRLKPPTAFDAHFFDFRQKPVAHQYGSRQWHDDFCNCC